MKSLESLKFMLGLIKEEPGDLWLKMTDEGLVLHVQICSGRAVPYRAFSIILITQITYIYFSSKTFVLIMCSSCFFRHDMNYTLALNINILATIVCSFLQTLFDHTGHIYIPHTTSHYLDPTQSIPNKLQAPPCFINLRWCFSFIMTTFVWLQTISLNCFVITLVALIFNLTMLGLFVGQDILLESHYHADHIYI